MRGIIAAAILALSTALLFVRLGHNPLWDDEAATALHGQAVWQTGDTGIILGHNIVAYNGGEALNGLHERSTPPLQSYLVAPFVGLLGNHAWAARLPFAFVGFFTIALLLSWMYSIRATTITWLIFGIALLCNVSLWLFLRQCRYYGPAIFSSIAVAYLYLNWNGGRKQLVLMSIASIVLLASNYLNFVALYLCMLVDYLIVGRKRRPLLLKDWLILILPLLVIGGVIVCIWNTLGTNMALKLTHNTPLQRLLVIWMNIRDLNRCQLGAGLLLIATPFLYFWRRDPWLIRAPLILLGYVLIIAVLSPQKLNGRPADADVRYLAPAIPLCIAIATLALSHVAQGLSGVLAIVIALVAFGTNVFNAVPLPNTPGFLSSAPVLFIRELINPPDDPFTPTLQWLKANIAAGSSIWITPAYSTYPLMFHAPQYVYAWQLKDPPPLAFKDFDPIHIEGRKFPSYIVAFGPYIKLVQELRPPAGYAYQQVHVIDTFFADLYRPELSVHVFKPVGSPIEWAATYGGDPDQLDIHIFQLVRE